MVDYDPPAPVNPPIPINLNTAAMVTVTDAGPDTRNVLARLASSRAVIVACVLLVIVGGLVAIGRVPYSGFVSMATWLGGIFIAGKSVEGAAAFFSGGKS